MPTTAPDRVGPPDVAADAGGASPRDRALAALVGALHRRGLATPPAVARWPGPEPSPCPVLRWAQSGAMALTGWPGERPLSPEGDVTARLEAALLLASSFGAATGDGPAADVGTLLAGRAAARGWSRRGATSVGGRCRLFPAADGWVAVTLAREADMELVPALITGTSATSPVSDRSAPVPSVLDEREAWDAVERHLRHRQADAVVMWAQQLGIPAAWVPVRRPSPTAPWSVTSLGAPHQRTPAGGSRPAAGTLVVDLSAMWAGPLCAHLLGRAGAQVVKVEDPARPDGARRGDPALFDALHRDHELVALDLSSPSGRDRLGVLVDRADVVIEGSRPRALGALGLDPTSFCAARPGRTWVSVTGYGRSGDRSNWVAFGDDAAVAGGLVARDDRGRPVFCADAVADPVTGLYAAVGALGSMAAGGGRLVDCAMAVAAAYANGGPGCPADHTTAVVGDRWTVTHGPAGACAEVVAEPAER